MQQIPPQVQNQLLQLRQLQQQAQALAVQKGQLEGLLRETEAALEELEKASPDEVVFRAVGEVLVRAKRDEVKAGLADKKETYGLRLKTLERQEERIQKRASELQTQIQQSIRMEPGGGTTGAG